MQQQPPFRPYPPASPPTQPGHRTEWRQILLIAAATLLALAILGQCVFDVGEAYQIGKIETCVFPPHSCQQP